MFGVFTFSFTNFLAKIIFSRGYGGVQNSSGNSGGVGYYFSGQKMGNSGRRGGLREIPSVVGVWIFSGTKHFQHVGTCTCSCNALPCKEFFCSIINQNRSHDTPVLKSYHIIIIWITFAVTVKPCLLATLILQKRQKYITVNNGPQAIILFFLF